MGQDSRLSGSSAAAMRSDARRVGPAGRLRSALLHLYSWLDARPVYRWPLLALVTIYVGLLVAPDLRLRSYPTDPALLGTPVTENIKAPYDLEVVDEDTTERLRHDAVLEVRHVFDFEAELGERTQARIARAFAGARPRFLPAAPNRSASERLQGGIEALRGDFEQNLGAPVTDEAWSALCTSNFAADVEEALVRLVVAIESEPLVDGRGELDAQADRGIALQRIPRLPDSGHRRELMSLMALGRVDAAGFVLIDDVSRLTDVASAKSQVQRLAPRLLEAGEPLADSQPVLRAVPHLVTILGRLAAHQLSANVSFNRAETDAARSRARDSVKQVKLTIKKNEMVVRDGERLTARHLMVLRSLGRSHQTTSVVLMAAGGVVLLLTLCTLGGQRLGPSRKQMRHLAARDWLFLAVLFCGSLTLSRLWLFLSRTAQEGAGHDISRQLILFCLPVAFGPLVARLVLRAEVALSFCILQALTLSLLADGNRMLTFYAVVGGVAAVGAIDSISRRGDLLRAGVQAGFAQTAAALGIQLFEATSVPSAYAWSIPAALFGGSLASILALSVTPVIEWAFNYTTDLKLLELANLNHPALKELIVQAPGSYHHSIIVGALVEAAAESIGANPLLARVMAYYHDLGKGCNPGYFIENQRSGQNPHDKLKPSMSAMIIRRHVTDGIDLAKSHGLGEQILAGIAQHHGNTLIHYFFHKAKELAEEGHVVSEEDYRYPGQKPQTREAALVMLGDSIEAASRALAEPSGPRLQGLVNRIISHKFTDGQLEECDLTLRDLHTIAKSFSVVLSSIYHHRMEYPSLTQDGSRRHGPGAQGGDTSMPVDSRQSSGAEPLRRLGL